MPSDNNHDDRSSLDKAFVVLESFDCRARTRGVSEIAREVSLPKSTVHRILQSLLDAGYVKKLGNGRYQLGPRVFELGSIYFRDTSLRRAALPHAHDLYQATKLTVFISVLDGYDILHVDHIPGRRHFAGIAMTIGKRWPLHTASAGKLFLAYAPPDLLEDYLCRNLRPFTKHSLTSPTLLLEDLAKIRRRGFSVSNGEGIEGIVGVSAPITGSNERVLAAISLASHGRQAIYATRALTTAAKRISAGLRGASQLAGRLADAAVASA